MSTCVAICSVLAVLPTNSPLLASALGAVGAVQAASDQVARHVIIIGANHSFDPGVQPLHYADDDALQFAYLFSPHARRVHLLTTIDKTTESRFGRAVPQARRPLRSELMATLASVREEVERERREGQVKSELTFIYVGHGGLDAAGQGYVHLADAAFTRADLFEQVLATSTADAIHVIIDACNAISFVAGRGAEERPPSPADVLFEKFLSGHDLEDYPNVGVLAATSSSRETHEWSEIQAGLFSYQLRSALSGAADVNLDAALEYSEVAAFVAAANMDVPEAAKRLSVFAWAPTRDRHAQLLAMAENDDQRTVLLGDRVSGRFFFESEAGVRWAEFNKSAGFAMRLWLPSAYAFFLRSEQHEMEIPRGSGVVSVADDTRLPYRIATRGAVDRAWRQSLFAVPFGYGFYRGYIAGYPDMLPVSAPTGVADGRELDGSERRLRLSIGYRVASFPLAKEYLEHGMTLGGAYALTPQVFVLLGVEGGRSSLSPLSARVGTRGAVTVGGGYRVAALSWLWISTAAELGYEVFVLGDTTSNADWAAGLGRIRLGFETHIGSRLSFEVSPAFSAHSVTVGGKRQWRERAELFLGIVW